MSEDHLKPSSSKVATLYFHDKLISSTSRAPEENDEFNEHEDKNVDDTENDLESGRQETLTTPSQPQLVSRFNSLPATFRYVEPLLCQIVVQIISQTTSQLKQVYQHVESAMNILNEKMQVENVDNTNYFSIKTVTLWQFVIEEARSYVSAMGKSTSSTSSVVLSPKLQNSTVHQKHLIYELDGCRLKFKQFVQFIQQLRSELTEIEKVFQKLLTKTEKCFRDNMESAKNARRKPQREIHECEAVGEDQEKEFDTDDKNELAVHVRWGIDGLCLKTDNETVTPNWFKLSNCNSNRKLYSCDLFVKHLSSFSDLATSDLKKARKLLLTWTSTTQEEVAQKPHEPKPIQLQLGEIKNYLKNIVAAQHSKSTVLVCPKEQVLLLQAMWQFQDVFQQLSQKVKATQDSANEIYELVQAMSSRLKAGGGKKANTVRNQEQPASFAISKDRWAYVTFELLIKESRIYFDLEKLFELTTTNNSESGNKESKSLEIIADIDEVICEKWDEEDIHGEEDGLSFVSSHRSSNSSTSNFTPIISDDDVYLTATSQISTRSTKSQMSLKQVEEAKETECEVVEIPLQTCIENRNKIHSEYLTASRQVLKTNRLNIQQLNLCSDSIKQFYLACHQLGYNLSQTIINMKKLFKKFNADSLEDCPGFHVRALISSRFVLQCFEKWGVHTWIFQAIQSILTDLKVLEKKTFDELEGFKANLAIQVKALVKLVEEIETKQMCFKERVIADEDAVANLVKSIEFKLTSKPEKAKNGSVINISPPDKERSALISINKTECKIFSLGNQFAKTKILKASTADQQTLFSLVEAFINDTEESLREIKNVFTLLSQFSVHQIVTCAKDIFKNTSKFATLTKLERNVITCCFNTLEMEILYAQAHLTTFMAELDPFKSLIEFQINLYDFNSSLARKMWKSLVKKWCELRRVGNARVNEMSKSESKFRKWFSIKPLELNMKGELLEENFEITQERTQREMSEMLHDFSLHQYQPTEKGCKHLRKKLYELLNGDEAPILQSGNFKKRTEKVFVGDFREEEKCPYLEKLETSPTISLETKASTLPRSFRCFTKTSTEPKADTKSEGQLYKLVAEFIQGFTSQFLTPLQSILAPRTNVDHSKCEFIGYFEGLCFFIYSISWRIRERASNQQLLSLQDKFEKLITRILKIQQLEKCTSSFVSNKINLLLETMKMRNYEKLKAIHREYVDEWIEDSNRDCFLQSGGNNTNETKNHVYEMMSKPLEEESFATISNSKKKDLEICWTAKNSEITLKRYENSPGIELASSSGDGNFTFDNLSERSKIRLLHQFLDLALHASNRTEELMTKLYANIIMARTKLQQINKYINHLQDEEHLSTNSVYPILKILETDMSVIMVEWSKLNIAIQTSRIYINNSCRQLCGYGCVRRAESELNPKYYSSNLSVMLKVEYRIVEEPGECERISLDTLNGERVNETELSNGVATKIQDSYLRNFVESDGMKTSSSLNSLQNPRSLRVLAGRNSTTNAETEIQSTKIPSTAELIHKDHLNNFQPSPPPMPKEIELLNNFARDIRSICALLEYHTTEMFATFNYPSASMSPEQAGNYSKSLALLWLSSLAIIQLQTASTFSSAKQDFSLSTCLMKIHGKLERFTAVQKKEIGRWNTKIKRLICSLEKRFKFRKMSDEGNSSSSFTETRTTSCTESKETIESVNRDTPSESNCANADYNGSNAALNTSDTSSEILKPDKIIRIGWTQPDIGLFIARLTEPHKAQLFESINEGKQKHILKALLNTLEITILQALNIQQFLILPNLKKIFKTLKLNKKILTEESLRNLNEKIPKSHNNNFFDYYDHAQSMVHVLSSKFTETQFQFQDILTGVHEIMAGLTFIESYTKLKISSEIALRKQAGEVLEVRRKAAQNEMIIYEKQLEQVKGKIEAKLATPISVTINFST